MAAVQVEVTGIERTHGRLTAREAAALCRRALAAAGIGDGHVAVEFVGRDRIRALNREHRGHDAPTDVLSFPVDEAGEGVAPRELGDVIICPQEADDLREAVVHGALHVAGMDHEADQGEMLALQGQVLGGRPDEPRETRSGFVALAGRPNTGKSTLVNAIVGEKVAIVSDKPQTTRRAIRGVATAEDWQLVLVDLPGVQRPRDALTERMQRRVEQEIAECDAAVMVLDATQNVGPGDRFIASALARGEAPIVVAVNKVDHLDRARTAAALQAASELLPEAEVFPVSARTGAGVGPLVEHLTGLLGFGPFYFPPEQRSDLPEDVRLAELVREQVLARTSEEVPHAVEVSVTEVTRLERLITIRADLWVEAESQKGILVGAGGRMIKAIGTAARRELERLLGGHVHLDLRVRVRRRWRADDALLDRLGI